MILFLSEFMLRLLGLLGYFSLFLPKIYKSELWLDTESSCVTIPLVKNVRSDGYRPSSHSNFIIIFEELTKSVCMVLNTDDNIIVIDDFNINFHKDE